MTLNAFDWAIIIIYLIGMIGLSFFLARGQKTGRDYYLGGNKTAPLPIALSTMATQCSTNSLLGATAFVAFAAGGGMIWLQYELVAVLCRPGTIRHGHIGAAGYDDVWLKEIGALIYQNLYKFRFPRRVLLRPYHRSCKTRQKWSLHNPAHHHIQRYFRPFFALLVIIRS
jgi:Na+/pantothenate symporter